MSSYVLTFDNFILRWASLTDSQIPGWRLRQIHVCGCQWSRRRLHSIWCESIMWVKTLFFVVQVSVSLTELGERLFYIDLFLIVYFCPSSVPPTIRGTDSDLPDEVTVLVNKTTQLECHVDGNPAPKITWFKDSQPVSSDGPHRILTNGRTLQVTTRKHTFCFMRSSFLFETIPS